eukprot:5589509-Amphidinium_carterae.1
MPSCNADRSRSPSRDIVSVQIRSDIRVHVHNSPLLSRLWSASALYSRLRVLYLQDPRWLEQLVEHRRSTFTEFSWEYPDTDTHIVSISPTEPFEPGDC